MMKRFHSISFLLFLCACSDTGTSHFPTKESMVWVYKITTTNRDGTSGGKHLITNLKLIKNNGRTTLQKIHHDGSINTFFINETGVFLSVPDEQNQKRILLKYPIETGTQWETNSSTRLLPDFDCGACDHKAMIRSSLDMKYEVESTTENLFIMAGKFSNVVKIIGKGNTSYDGGHVTGIVHITIASTDWYVPGYGLVKTQWNETSDNEIIGKAEYTMELEKLYDE